MPLTKGQYEKAIGRKLTDAEYGKLSGVAQTERAPDEATFWKPSNINATAPKSAQLKGAKKEAWLNSPGTDVTDEPGKPNLYAPPEQMVAGNAYATRNDPIFDASGKVIAAKNGGGGYSYGVTNVPKGAKYLDAFGTKPSADAGPTQKSFATESVGSKIGAKPAAPVAAPNLGNQPIVAGAGGVPLSSVPKGAVVAQPINKPGYLSNPLPKVAAAAPAPAPAYESGMDNDPTPDVATSAVNAMTDTVDDAYGRGTAAFDHWIAAGRRRLGL